MTLENTFYILAIIMMIAMLVAIIMLFVVLLKLYRSYRQLEQLVIQKLEVAEAHINNLQNKKGFIMGLMPVISLIGTGVFKYLRKK